MGIFSSWFKRKPAADPAPAQSAPAQNVLSNLAQPQRTIRYDQNLVTNLKKDHIELVYMYTQLGDDVHNDRFERIADTLLAFKTRLEAHLLVENLRFYVYLEQSLANDADNVGLIRDFRQEMNRIARGVVEFVKRYQQQRVTHENQAAFMHDYNEVGRLLTLRIEREESNLYPLYAP
jgi:hypothetical protein